MADEGFHEAAELMLDERHLALKRCLAFLTRLKSISFTRWSTLTLMNTTPCANLSGNKQQVTMRMIQVLSNYGQRN